MQAALTWKVDFTFTVLFSGDEKLAKLFVKAVHAFLDLVVNLIYLSFEVTLDQDHVASEVLDLHAKLVLYFLYVVRVFLERLLEHALQLVALLVQTLLQLQHLLLCNFSELIDCALPGLTFQRIFFCWLNHNHVDFFFVFSAFLRQNWSCLGQNHQLGADCLYVTLLHQLVEDVAHDGNEHVEHCDVHEEGGCAEHSNSQCGLVSAHKLVTNGELAKRDQILIVDGIDEPPAEALWDHEL